MGPVNRNLRKIWGGTPEVQSEELRSAVEDLQADLQALVQDLRRGPVAAQREQVEAYLSELRREFLRPHRRLQVQVRSSEGQGGAQESLRRELAELADRFRSVVLSRSSRIQHDVWTPAAIAEAVHTAVEALPRLVSAPYEARTFAPQPGDGLGVAWRRRMMRAERWLRRMVKEDYPERPVELRELARYHLEGKAVGQIEGVAALVFQSEVQLAGRSRQLLEAITQGFEALVSHVDQDDFPDMLAGLRFQLEDEFGAVEQDIGQILDDSVHRAEMIFGDALQTLKAELPIVATVDLPAWQRKSAAVVGEAQRTLGDMTARLDRLREHVAASYVLLGLHLEFLGYRSRVQHTMDGVLAELRADVRGRSRVQLERVLAVVDEVLGALEHGDGQFVDDSTVRARVEPLEHVVEEAAGVTRQLLDQLSDEASVAPILEALNREAHGLTDRYRVPEGKIPRTEWKLPDPVGLTEVNFADLVSGYVQREVAPELLTTTNRAMDRVVPIIDVFQDLQRVVSFDSESFDDRLDVSTTTPAGEQQLAALMQSTLQRSREAIAQRLEDIAHWDEDLVADMRKTVVAKLDELRRGLGAGDISRVRLARGPEPRLQLRGQVDRVTDGALRFKDRSAEWLRDVVGEARLARFREALGLMQPALPTPVDGAAWAPPGRLTELPVFYTRLFTAQARWAGDVLNVPEAEVRRARDALFYNGPGPKAVALVGFDAASRGALAGAVLRGAKTVRRLAFSQPTSVDQVRTMLADLGSPSVVQLSGIGWLTASRPGGFQPLQRLLESLLKDGRRGAWLLEVDTLVWLFASAVTPLADVFSTQIRLPPMTPVGLEEAILARHQLSGYRLEFELDGQSEPLGAERSPQRERYFQALYAASGGLLQVALPMWLASVGRVAEDASTVYVSQAPQTVLSALQRLPEPVWSALFVIARQGWADSATLSHALHVEPTAAEGRLAGLAGLGLLERQGRDVYVIKRHLRGAVVRGLRGHGWLDATQ